MKKFGIFFVLSVIAFVLSHLIAKWIGLEDSSTAVNIVPVAFLFFVFYICGYYKSSSGK